MGVKGVELEDDAVVARDDEVRFCGEDGVVKRLKRADSSVGIERSDTGDERQGMARGTDRWNGAVVAHERHSKTNR